MRKFLLLKALILISFMTVSKMKSQVIINEIQYDGVDMIELKNIGNTSVDVSSYYLCSFPTYNKISDVTTVSGSTTLEPGAFLVLSGHDMIADGELGLYSTNSFASSSEIVDYVEWVSTGHQRSSVAVTANTWTNNNFINPPASGETIQFDGKGNTSADYTSGTANFGSDNVNFTKIVINEVQYEGTDMIELKNIGNTSVDLSDYFLCSFPTYNKISNVTTISGSTTLAPNALLVLSGHDMIADGELALYSTNSFASSDAIIDYVEWVSSGHQRSSVAVTAGTWTTNDFINATGALESIQFDGSGNTSADYTSGASNFGSENLNFTKIVINEIQYEGTDMIELKNIGGSTVDVADYYLCSFPTYNKISNVTTVSGSTTMTSGSLLVLSGHDMITDGELGLYSTNSFGSSSAIVDYVEWVSSGHKRSSVAVAANTWTNNSFVNAIASGESLQFDGHGNQASDYASFVPSFGSENSNNILSIVNEKENISINIYPNPTSNYININTDELEVTFKLYDLTGKVVKIQNTPSNSLQMNINTLNSGIYLLEISNNRKVVSRTKIIKN